MSNEIPDNALRCLHCDSWALTPNYSEFDFGESYECQLCCDECNATGPSGYGATKELALEEAGNKFKARPEPQGWMEACAKEIQRRMYDNDGITDWDEETEEFSPSKDKVEIAAIIASHAPKAVQEKPFAYIAMGENGLVLSEPVLACDEDELKALRENFEVTEISGLYLRCWSETLASTKEASLDAAIGRAAMRIVDRRHTLIELLPEMHRQMVTDVIRDEINRELAAPPEGMGDDHE